MHGGPEDLSFGLVACGLVVHALDFEAVDEFVDDLDLDKAGRKPQPESKDIEQSKDHWE